MPTEEEKRDIIASLATYKLASKIVKALPPIAATTLFT